MNSVKDSVLEIATKLPPESTWDEVMERIYVRQKIEAGLADLENGRKIEHDDLFEEIQNANDSVD